MRPQVRFAIASRWVPSCAIRLTLRLHDRRDWCCAGRALMLCPTGNKDRGVAGDRCYHRADRSARVTLIIDIGIRQHGVATSADTARRARLCLGKHTDDALNLLGTRVALELEAGITERLTHPVGVNRICEHRV